MFAPTPDQGDMPTPGAGALSNLITGQAPAPAQGQPAMQPPQSPEEHAQNKQGWLDWFHNPATASFLLQFGASMLQPNIGGFGAQLGRSIGEAGGAVGRLQEQDIKQQEQQTATEEAKQRGQYYGAQAAAIPQEAEARLKEASAALQNAKSKEDLVAAQSQWLQERGILQQEAIDARSAGMGDKAALIDSRIRELDATSAAADARAQLDKAKAVSPMKQAAVDAYWRAVNAFSADITGQLKMPDPKTYGLAPADIGQPTPATTTPSPTSTTTPRVDPSSTVTPSTATPSTSTTQPPATPTTGSYIPDLSKLPPFKDTPASRDMLDTALATSPATLDAFGVAWKKQGMSETDWQKIKQDTIARSHKQ